MTARRALTAGVALLTAAGIFASAPTASAAQSLTDAKKQAATLAAQVSHLTDQAELASEDYDAAQEQLRISVIAYGNAQQQLETAQAADSAGSALVSSQAAALYEAGGPAPLYAEALNGADLGDVVERMSIAGNVIRSSQDQAAHASGATARLSALNKKLAAAATQRSNLGALASRKAAEVTSLLARQRQLLAAANSQVKTITVALQQKAERAAALRFARELAAAQSLAASQQLIGGATAPTAAAGQAILAAQSRIGTPYVWGATGPGAFDCSGLTSWAYAQAGILLPRTSREQWNAGPHVALGDLQPGDLLFWALNPGNPATIHHVAMYVGNNQMIAAPHTGANVQVQPVYMNGFIGAVRPTG